MRSSSLPALALSLTLAVAGTWTAIAGCADGDHAVVGYESDDGSPDAGAEAASDDVGNFGDAVPEASNMGGCSGDLHHVVDDHGHVIKDCPDDQGCLNGTCVPACQAAAGSHGNVGCDYLVATPAFHYGMEPPCLAAFVANNWPKENAVIDVEYDGQKLDVTKFGRVPNGGSDATAWPAVSASGIKPGEVAVLFLADVGSFACPIPPAETSTAVWTQQPDATGRGKAFHITTTFPVTTYDILPYGGARSFLPGAELVMPTSAWGTNYVAMVPQRGQFVSWGPQFLQVVASQDNTVVSIVPTHDLPSGTNVPGGAANTVMQIVLGAGEFAQWQDAHEVSGTILQSTKPIAVVGGNDYLCLASKTSPSGGGCDSAHQMVPPISALGSEYVAAPFLTRRQDLADESILYRIVGTVKDTTLAFDPPLQGVPATLDRGTVADFETTGAFRVSSQDDKHPFFIVQEMPGCPNPSRPGAQTIPNTCDPCLGDEDFVDMLPPAQFLSSYVFFTDPTYWTTNLALVRVKDSGGFHDVSVDCAGVVGGWKDVGATGKYQVTTLELVRGNAGIGNCANGVHTATSDGAFGVTVWGEDCASSYGYPAGGNAAVINQVIVPPTPK